MTCEKCGQERRAQTSRTPEGAWACGCPVKSSSVSIRERVFDALERLGKEHGSETFVTDGYAYHDDAMKEFTDMLRAVRADALEEAAKTVESAPAGFNRNDHAERIRLRKNGDTTT